MGYNGKFNYSASLSWRHTYSGPRNHPKWTAGTAEMMGHSALKPLWYKGNFAAQKPLHICTNSTIFSSSGAADVSNIVLCIYTFDLYSTMGKKIIIMSLLYLCRKIQYFNIWYASLKRKLQMII